MKKKAALLLAFVMVLSLLPMNVFGRVPTGQPGSAQQHSFTSASPRNTQVFINYQPLIGVPVEELTLVATVHGYWNPNNLRFGVQTGLADGVPVISTTRNDLDTEIAALNPFMIENVTPWSQPGYANWDIQARITDVGPLGPLGGVSSDARTLHIEFDRVATRGALSSDVSGFAGAPMPTLQQIGMLGVPAWQGISMPLTLPIVVNHNDAHITVHAYRNNVRLATLVDSQPLTDTVTGDRLAITSGSEIAFTTDLLVPRITVRELRNRIFMTGGGDYAHPTAPWTAIRLTAPRDYTWSTSMQWGAGGLQVTAGNGVSFAHAEAREGTANAFNRRGNVTNDAVRVVNRGRDAATDREVLYVLVNTQRFDFGGLDELRIDGLWLRPELRAPQSGNVHIDVHVGSMSAGTVQNQMNVAVDRFANRLFVLRNSDGDVLDVQTVNAGDPNPNAWINATRSALSVANPHPSNNTPVVLSPGAGTPGEYWARMTHGDANRVPAGIGFPEFAGTVSIPSTETTVWIGAGTTFDPSTWQHHNTPGRYRNNVLVGVRGGAALTFNTVGEPREVRTGTFGDPTWAGRVTGSRDDVRTSAVRLTEVIPASWNSSLTNATVFTFDDPGVRILGARIRAWHGTGDFANWNRLIGPGGWVDVLLEDGVGGIFEVQGTTGAGSTGGRVAIAPDRLEVHIPIQYQAGYYATRIHQLEVEFWISVEAGYEHKYGSDIEVTISGGAITNLPENQRTAVVARAVDPVTVSVTGPIVDAVTGSLYQVTNQRISDIVITETVAGNLEIGDEIWLYVIGDTRRQMDMTLTTGRFPQTTGGLVLREGRPLRHQHANFWLDGMVFVVEQRSHGTPATITFSDVYVSGQAFPGVTYSVVVSGNAVADNDFEVWSSVPGRGTGSGLGRLHTGTFPRDPYSAPVLRHEAGGISAPPAGGPGLGGGQFVNRGQLVLRETMGAIESSAGLVEDPFRLVPVPGTRYAVSMLNPRVFADFIGAELDYAAGRIEFTGLDSNGTPVTVVLNVGQTTATVNGEVVDIATFAGARELANSVETMRIGDRTFVPVRFLSNAFLLPISFVSGTVTIG